MKIKLDENLPIRCLSLQSRRATITPVSSSVGFTGRIFTSASCWNRVQEDLSARHEPIRTECNREPFLFPTCCSRRLIVVAGAARLYFCHRIETL